MATPLRILSTLRDALRAEPHVFPAWGEGAMNELLAVLNELSLDEHAPYVIMKNPHGSERFTPPMVRERLTALGDRRAAHVRSILAAVDADRRIADRADKPHTLDIINAINDALDDMSNPT